MLRRLGLLKAEIQKQQEAPTRSGRTPLQRSDTLHPPSGIKERGERAGPLSAPAACC